MSGSGTAVWEVINTNPSQNENANFAVFTLYAPNAGNNTSANRNGYGKSKLCSDAAVRSAFRCAAAFSRHPAVCGYLDGKTCDTD